MPQLSISALQRMETTLNNPSFRACFTDNNKNCWTTPFLCHRALLYQVQYGINICPNGNILEAMGSCERISNNPHTEFFSVDQTNTTNQPLQEEGKGPVQHRLIPLVLEPPYSNDVGKANCLLGKTQHQDLDP